MAKSELPIDDSNALLQNWRAEDALSFSELNPSLGIECSFAEVTEPDVVSLDEALAKGWRPTEGPASAAQELACMNLAYAQEMGLREAVVKRCAKTLVGRCVGEDLSLARYVGALTRALATLNPGDLKAMDHYRALVAVGRTLSRLGGKADIAIEHYERAAELARSPRRLPKASRNAALAIALGGIRRTLSQAGDHASAIARIWEALDLFPAEVERITTATRLGLLEDLGTVLEASGDIRSAVQAVEEEAAGWRALDNQHGEQGTAIARRLLALGPMLSGMGQHGEAAEALHEARTLLQKEVAEQEHPIISARPLLWSATALLCEVVHKAKRGKEAAHLLDQVLADEGPLAAAWSGHQGARKIERLTDAQWMAAPVGDLGPVPSPNDDAPPQYRRLLAILNAEPGMATHMAQDWERHAEDAEQRAGTTRSVLPPVALAYRSVADFYRCVPILQRLAASVCDKEYVEVSQNEIRFRDFALGDLALLKRSVGVGRTFAERCIEAGRAGTSEGWLNYSDSAGDYYYPLPGSEVVDLCTVELGPAEPEPMDHTRWVWEAFELIMDAARTGTPQLRRCKMPRGLDTHLDYLLGESEQDAPACGTFYITWRGGETCGREACKKAFRRLQDEYETDIAKRTRAEALALREWKAAERPGLFEELWEKSDRDLTRFRDLLGAGTQSPQGEGRHRGAATSISRKA